jgi:hypothetical protein
MAGLRQVHEFDGSGSRNVGSAAWRSRKQLMGADKASFVRDVHKTSRPDGCLVELVNVTQHPTAAAAGAFRHPG